MKNNLLILSLFLLFPLTVDPVRASSVEREVSVGNSHARAGLVQNVKYYAGHPRTKSFVAKTTGSTFSLLTSTVFGTVIDGIYPNCVSEFIIDYVGNNYVVGGTICLIGAYQLCQAMFGKVDNRPIMTQVMDATGVPSLTEMVWNTIKSDPKKGSTLIARDLGVSEKEVRKTLRENGWDNEANRKAAASGRSKTPSRARR